MLAGNTVRDRASLGSARGAGLDGLRGVVVGSDGLAAGLLCGYLLSCGLDCVAVGSVGAALDAVNQRDPHVVVVDLDGPLSSDFHCFLVELSRDRPFVSFVALSAHWSPELGWADAGEAADLLARALYVPKAALSGPGDVLSLVISALSGLTGLTGRPRSGLVPVSPAQAEVLRLVASGLNNAEIARLRGTSVRAVEAMLRRVFTSAEARHAGVVSRVSISRRVWEHEIYVLRRSSSRSPLAAADGSSRSPAACSVSWRAGVRHVG